MTKGKTPENLAGKKFGRLTALEDAGRTLSRSVLWLCACECGGAKVVSAQSLKKGTTRSCGCLHREELGNRRRTHGGSRSAEYSVWESMKSRCLLTSSTKYKDYGGRGIRVCDRWLNSFAAFLADMGLRPSKEHTLERKNNDGNYEPDNCVWATRSTQAKNKRNIRKFTHAGRTLTLSQWSEVTGIPLLTLRTRVRRGWSVERVLASAIHFRRPE